MSLRPSKPRPSTRSAEDEANKKEDRYYSAVEELAKVEKKIASVTAEREELVDRIPRAELDEEYALGDELKERYKNLGRALEAWEKQRDSLEGDRGATAPA